MAIDWTRFAGGDKHIVRDAQRLSRALAETEREHRRRRPMSRVVRARPRGFRFDGRIARTIGDVARASPPLPFGIRRHRTEIFGAGLVLVGDEARPAILADERVTEARAGEVRPIGEEPHILGHCRRAEGISEAPPKTVVLAMPPPTPQFGPTATVRGPGTLGTCGVCVTTPDGRAAILTAGHTAAAGDVVRDGEDRYADVVFSVAPTRVPQGQVTADVAVLVPHLDSALTCGAIAGTADPTGGARITMMGAVSGTNSTRVMGVMPYVFTPTMPGQWADTYLTTFGVSAAGDSGAPVLLGDGAADQLVGHLVGASGAITSFVQDIDVQIRASGCTLRLGT